MKQTLLFATSNKHKALEAKRILKSYEILTLDDIGFTDEIEEPFETFEENAWHKARTIAKVYPGAIFAEDTGLEIDALNGDPGIYTARYAGPDRDAKKNMEKVLTNLADKSDRSAQFRTYMAFLHNKNEFGCEGIVRGKIAASEQGNQGFGYDPLFIPDGHEETFAEMGEELKDSMSHRKRALEQLASYLFNGNQ